MDASAKKSELSPLEAFLFRAESDVLTAKFAVSMRESSELAQMYADTEARLNALKEKVNRKEGSVEKMQKEIDALGGGSAGRQHLVQFFRSDKKPSEQKNAKRQRCFEIFPSGNGWKRRLLQGFQIPSYRPMDP